METKKKILFTTEAPNPIGPYSQAVQIGNLIYTAGQLGIDPQTNEIVGGGIQSETRQSLTNIKNILEKAGSSLENVIKTTVYMKDMNEFALMNQIYAEFFTEKFPARTTIQAGALPKNASIEIEAIAYLE